MTIQYKIGYGPQYTVHGKTLSSPPSEENLRHKGTGEEALSGISNTLIINILDKSNMS